MWLKMKNFSLNIRYIYIFASAQMNLGKKIQNDLRKNTQTMLEKFTSKSL